SFTAGDDLFEIVADGARGSIAVFGSARKQPPDHGRQAWSAAVAQRWGRQPRLNALLKSARVWRLERQTAAHHFVQQNADCPEIRLRIDLARLEPLRRQIRDAAKVVARDLSAQRQRLGDPEIEDLDAIALGHPDVAGFEIAVQ